ncbi:MAG TPA: hypothetical protein VKA95_06040 [Nitrososphaeraceae archaeon]|nr:hypothetical protein [Nitrososphaeraceae archaeon]
MMGSENSPSIDLSQVYDDTQRESRVKRFRKAFNVERQALEAVELRTIISENNALRYLQNKKYLAKEKWNIIASMNK